MLRAWNVTYFEVLYMPYVQFRVKFVVAIIPSSDVPVHAPRSHHLNA